MDLATLKLDRLDLVLAIGDGGFPGSKAWKAMRAAEMALEAFDLAHPEVIAAIHAESAAELAGRWID